VNGLFGRITLILFFASSYVVNIPRFKLIALIIVGVHPVHKPNIPSSAGIRLAASKKFLYPRLLSGGSKVSAYNLTRIISAGFPTIDPSPPAVREQTIFYFKVSYSPSLPLFI
jgi:hypothetical protein